MFFFVTLAVVGSAVLIAMPYFAYRNPRRVWHRKHGGETKGGEPTEAALAKIQRNAVLVMILGPILMILLAVSGYSKLERIERRDRRLEQLERNEFKRSLDQRFGRPGETPAPDDP